MSRRAVCRLLICLLTVLVAPVVSFSSVLGPDFPVWEWVGVNACNESEPAVAYNAGLDEYLVAFVWDLDGDTDIVAVRVSAGGNVIGSPFSVTSTFSNEITPAIARNPVDDEYLVVWQRWSSTTGFDIYGRIISHTGTVGSEFDIAAYPGNQQSASVDYATGSARYLVVWEEADASIPTAPDIAGRCVSSAGALLGSPIAVAPYDGNQLQPAIAMSAFDYSAMVAWRNDGGSSMDIAGRRVTTLGDCGNDGPLIDVGSIPGSASGPAVAWGQTDAGYGEFLVTWIENDVAWGRRVDGYTSTIVGPGITVSSAVGNKHLPAVAYASDRREWWVVWYDDRDGPDRIYGQFVLADGTLPFPGTDQRVSMDPGGLPPSELQVGPDLAFSPTTGSALVAWTDNGHYEVDDAGFYGVWGRHWQWPLLFADGFESGSTSAWSESQSAP